MFIVVYLNIEAVVENYRALQSMSGYANGHTSQAMEYFAGVKAYGRSMKVVMAFDDDSSDPKNYTYEGKYTGYVDANGYPNGAGCVQVNDPEFMADGKWEHGTLITGKADEMTVEENGRIVVEVNPVKWVTCWSN